jgi:hypothetical protein
LTGGSLRFGSNRKTYARSEVYCFWTRSDHPSSPFCPVETAAYRLGGIPKTRLNMLVKAAGLRQPRSSAIVVTGSARSIL